MTNKAMSETIEQRAERIVRQEVYLCLSSLVATLAKPGLTSFDAFGSIEALCDQALGLAAPVPDYEEAATQAGWRLHKCDDGTFDAIESDEDSATLRNRTADTVWQDICDHAGIDPYDREVFEHWAVSPWLADKLLEQGEKVDKDFAGMCVWARTTTGQGIANDSCIKAIARSLDKVEA